MFRLLATALFGAAGIALGAINVWNNATQVNGGTFVLNDLTAIVLGLAVAGALLSLALGAIRQRSTLTTGLAVIAIIGCSATSVGYTLGRVGSAADTGAEAAQAHNARIDRTEAEIARLRGLVTAQASIAANQCIGFKPGVSDERRWPKCNTARNLVAGYEAQIATEQKTLAQLGAPRVADPAGERLEAVSGGLITAHAYRTAHPVIVAGALELSVSLLLTIAGLFAASGARAPKVIDVTPVDPVERVLRAQRAAITNRELAQLAGISEASAHRTVKALAGAGRVVKHRDGRAMLIKLVA